MADYYLPHAAGVAFSRNLYRWSPQIRREDGFLRLVWGLGTRAVDRVGNDYPRLVALSHPLLHPAASPKEIRRYSQQYVDLINLEENRFETLPIRDVLQARYPVLRYLAQLDQGGYLTPLRSMIMDGGPDQLVLTFDGLLRRTPLAARMHKMLSILEHNYHSPVDTEFTVQDSQPDGSAARGRNHPAAVPPAEPHEGNRSPPAPAPARRRHHLFHPPHGARGPSR